MPELPEVETVARDLARMVVGRRIVSARVLRERNLATPDPSTFTRAIAGREIRRVRRRAKWIIVELEGGLALLVHLRMTGQLLVLPVSAPLIHTFASRSPSATARSCVFAMCGHSVALPWLPAAMTGPHHRASIRATLRSSAIMGPSRWSRASPRRVSERSWQGALVA